MGRHTEGIDKFTFLAVNKYGLVYLLHSLFYVAGGEHKKGPCDLWEEKGEIPTDGISTLVKLTLLHFALNALFRGIDRSEFDMHVALLSSVNPCDLDATTHQVATEEDEGSCVMRSCRIAFVPAYVAYSVLGIIQDSVAAPIAQVV